MTRSKITLGIILFLAFLIRVLGLGSVPGGFSPDEASQGYSAYSLLQTGKDEWGTSYPVTSFKSFLDYKAPLQTYLMVPSIAIFGLSEFSVRLPSAIIGTLAIIAIYFLTKELFKNTAPTTSHLALIASLMLAISPWHIQFSRTALEVNLLSFLFPAGLYFFLKFIDSDPRTNNQEPANPLILTSLFWGLGLYAYHAAKIFLPIFIMALIVVTILV